MKKLTPAQQELIDALKAANGKLPAFGKGIKLHTVRKLVDMGLIEWSDPKTETDKWGRVWTTHTTITLI